MAAGASRRSRRDRCRAARTARPRRGSRASRGARWRARTPIRSAPAGRGPARSRGPPTARPRTPGVGSRRGRTPREIAYAETVVGGRGGLLPAFCWTMVLASGSRTSGSSSSVAPVEVTQGGWLIVVPAVLDSNSQGPVVLCPEAGSQPVEEGPGGLRYRCGNGEFALFEFAGAAAGDHAPDGVERPATSRGQSRSFASAARSLRNTTCRDSRRSTGSSASKGTIPVREARGTGLPGSRTARATCLPSVKP